MGVLTGPHDRKFRYLVLLTNGFGGLGIRSCVDHPWLAVLILAVLGVAYADVSSCDVSS